MPRASLWITQRGDQTDNVRTEVWAAPGLVTSGSVYDNETRQFAQPLQRYNFPMAPGRIWNQWVANLNDTTHREGAINRYVVVGSWQKITTPAGTFDAIQLNVIMRLDDEEFWRGPTTCDDRVWYAPAGGAFVLAMGETSHRLNSRSAADARSASAYLHTRRIDRQRWLAAARQHACSPRDGSDALYTNFCRRFSVGFGRRCCPSIGGDASTPKNGGWPRRRRIGEFFQRSRNDAHFRVLVRVDNAAAGPSRKMSHPIRSELRPFAKPLDERRPAHHLTHPLAIET